MNLSSYGHKFFIFSGVLLIAIAAVQMLLRRQGNDGSAGPRMGAAMVQTVLFLTVGVLAVLAGAGLLPLPGIR